MSAALNTGFMIMSSEYSNGTLCLINYAGQNYRVEQTLYETSEFCVYEMSEEIELNGQNEKYLAVTRHDQLFSIDVLAGPKELLTRHHGPAIVAWI